MISFKLEGKFLSTFIMAAIVFIVVSISISMSIVDHSNKKSAESEYTVDNYNAKIIINGKPIRKDDIKISESETSYTVEIKK